MITPLRDLRAVLAPGPEHRHGPLQPMLLVLTVVTGVVDAFSYLVLGNVFVANMTGNVVFTAFSLAGATAFSLRSSLVSLLAFAAGAVLGGRIGNRFPDHRARLLLGATVLETALVLVAYVCSETLADPFTGTGRDLLIVLLALAMGAQNAAARRLAVPDFTTTVLTQTLTGLASDSPLAGEADGRFVRRALAVAGMFAGALAGGLIALHASRTLPLLIAGLLLAATATAASARVRSTDIWTRPV
ncbi:YoaK family protein [Kitasatospora kazusensis]|uniref:YoaK family protein n=1 Tax=Kitasatospora kazusensis TaxID=407974 RepID=A0ABP5LPB3_9ACTN